MQVIYLQWFASLGTWANVKQYLHQLSGKIHIDTKEDLKSVFEAYYKPLVVFAKTICPPEDSEDIVQEIFVNLWKGSTSFDDDKALKSFLYKAVKNKCLNFLKHLKIKKGYAESKMKIYEDSKYIENVSHKLELSQTLHSNISLLSERKKEVIMYMIKGMRNQEIAERMGIKLQTVKTLKSQAYKELRNLLLNKT